MKKSIQKEVPLNSKFPILNSAKRGFTMIELLVTMAIFLMLTGVVLTNYRGFNTNALFANASEDVVLSLRQAQVYGAGTKGSSLTCGSSAFDCPYGVHFSTEPTEKSQIKIFVDGNSNKIYNTGEEIEVIQWADNISVTSLQCGTLLCTLGMDVTFNRPNPDAYITDSSGANNDRGVIILTDTNTTNTSTVTITSAGQISVQ